MTPRMLPLAGLLLLASTHARADFRVNSPDTTPPEVMIVEPRDGAMTDDGPVVVLVEAIDPESDDDDIHGIAMVWLEIDDTLQSEIDEESPFRFELDLETGTHHIRAAAIDLEGNETRAWPLVVHAGEVTDATDADDPSRDIHDRGCGCTGEPTRDRGWFALALLLGAAWHRRW